MRVAECSQSLRLAPSSDMRLRLDDASPRSHLSRCCAAAGNCMGNAERYRSRFECGLSAPPRYSLIRTCLNAGASASLRCGNLDPERHEETLSVDHSRSAGGSRPYACSRDARKSRTAGHANSPTSSDSSSVAIRTAWHRNHCGRPSSLSKRSSSLTATPAAGFCATPNVTSPHGAAA
jgi:hypothetical protein